MRPAAILAGWSWCDRPFSDSVEHSIATLRVERRMIVPGSERSDLTQPGPRATPCRRRLLRDLKISERFTSTDRALRELHRPLDTTLILRRLNRPVSRSRFRRALNGRGRVSGASPLAALGAYAGDRIWRATRQRPRPIKP